MNRNQLPKVLRLLFEIDTHAENKRTATNGSKVDACQSAVHAAIKSFKASDGKLQDRLSEVFTRLAEVGLDDE